MNLKLLSLGLVQAGCLLVAALPTNDTMVAAFAAPFQTGTDNWQTCSQGELQQIRNIDSNFADPHDCVLLGQSVAARSGFWEISGWTSLALDMVSHGSCHIRVSRQDGKDSDVLIGNLDIFDLLVHTSKVVGGRRIAVMGVIYCEDSQQNTVEITVSVMN